MCLGKNYDAWNPVSFYEHMGFERCDQNGLDVLVWKPFVAEAEPPRLLRPQHQHVDRPIREGAVGVTSIINGWCGGGCQQCVMARDAAERSDGKADLREVYVSEWPAMAEVGESIDVVYLDGEPYRPDGPPWGVDDLLEDINQRRK